MIVKLMVSCITHPPASTNHVYTYCIIAQCFEHVYTTSSVSTYSRIWLPPLLPSFLGPWGWGNGGEVCSILSPRFLSPTSHRDFINAFSAHLFLRLSFFSHRITIVRFVTWPSPIPLNPCAKVVNDHMDSIPYSPLKMHCVHLLCALNTEEPSLHFTINS